MVWVEAKYEVKAWPRQALVARLGRMGGKGGKTKVLDIYKIQRALEAHLGYLNNPDKPLVAFLDSDIVGPIPDEHR